MSDVCRFTPGATPILVSMPHSGTRIPESIAERLTERARTLPDTDWHIPRLYDFVHARGHSVLQAEYGRYVVDLNRPPNDESLYPGQATTGLCPDILFDGEALYLAQAGPDETEIARRRDSYWAPYHDRLARALAAIRARFGFAILYDAHSIASHVPRLFDGRLPDLNLGTAGGASCDAGIQQAVFDVIDRSRYGAVVNGRFRGGYITRHYGDPSAGVHALQMEITQRNYMHESGDFAYDESRALCLQETLTAVFDALMAECATRMGSNG